MSMVGFELEDTELRLGLPGGTREIGSGGGSNTSATVGWPPVCSYRRRSIGSEQECHVEGSKRTTTLVKISMDGVPFLRKLDVNEYQHYSSLLSAIEYLFACSGIGEALKDADKYEYVPIYEDKDGDWLLIGDVPWKMFVESCKRLRIMKRSDAKGFGFPSKKVFQG